MPSSDCKPLEIDQCKEIGRDCVCFKVRKSARALTKLYEKALRPSGLRSTQFSLLMAARILGPVTVVKLAEATVVDRTTLTRNLQVLEKRGLIAINPGEDRREREVTLTASGMEVLVQAIPFWEAAQEQVRQGLGETKMHDLLDNLSEIIALAKEK